VASALVLAVTPGEAVSHALLAAVASRLDTVCFLATEDGEGADWIFQTDFFGQNATGKMAASINEPAVRRLKILFFFTIFECEAPDCCLSVDHD
jgi:hypothetical protein